MPSFWFKPPKLPRGRMSLGAMIVMALFALPFLAFLIVFIAAYLIVAVRLDFRMNPNAAIYFALFNNCDRAER